MVASSPVGSRIEYEGGRCIRSRVAVGRVGPAALRGPVQRGCLSLRRLILPQLEDTFGGLDLVPGTPSGDEGTRQGGIADVDREGIVQHAACP